MLIIDRGSLYVQKIENLNGTDKCMYGVFDRNIQHSFLVYVVRCLFIKVYFMTFTAMGCRLAFPFLIYSLIHCRSSIVLILLAYYKETYLVRGSKVTLDDAEAKW